MMLIPQFSNDGIFDWKVWVLTTWLVGFAGFPEDEARLREPSTFQTDIACDGIEKDVVIIGAGNR